MIITDGRIKLRAIEETDMDFCREMINSSYIESCTINKNLPVSEKKQIEWFRNYDQDREVRLIIEIDSYRLGMIIASNVNWINRTCEVAIKLLVQDKMKPNDTLEAGKLFLGYLYGELNMNCVYAHILEENRLSYKLLSKFGFVKEGVLRQRVYKRGAYHNVVVLSLLREEFEREEDE